VHAQNFIVDERSDGEAVEAIRESFPELDIVSSFA